MGDEVVKQILNSYGLAYTAVLSTEKGYRNESHPVVLTNGKRANLILYKSEPGILAKIKCANLVSDYLVAQGFPARKTIDRRTIKLQSGSRVKYGALYEYLDGTTIPWEAYTMEHIKLLGKTMSDMHAALQDIPTPTKAKVADEYLAIIKRVRTYFANAETQQAVKRKLRIALDTFRLERLNQIVRATKKLPGQQTLHMDFVRGNILFENETTPKLTGILDFEKTAFGHPSFDIARTLAFLLVDCKYKEPEKIRKYFLASGYTKRGAATFVDIKFSEDETLLESLIELFLIYDFYKFLKHNPYESLAENEHYARTKDILLSKDILLMLK